MQHESETEMSKIPDSAFNYVINNNGSLDEYREKVASVLYKEGLML
jgi:hypothetical protein